MRARQRLNRALMLGLVSVSVMSTVPGARAAAAPPRSFAVEPGHPRIFFTQKDLAVLRKRIQTTHAAQWRGMKRWADSQMGKNRPAESIEETKKSSPRPRIVRQHWWQPRAYAFLYRLGGEQRYADEAIGMAKKLDIDIGWQTKKDLGITIQAKTLALVYDWCYDRLTPDDKAALLKNLEAHADWLFEYTGHRHHAMNAHLSTDAGDMGLAGLAMHGDHPNAEKYIAAALSVIKDFVRVYRHFSAPGDGMVGCEGGSMEYARHALIPIFTYLDAFSSALGKDMFVPEFENFTYGLLYGTYPDKTMVPIGDGKTPNVSHFERRYLSMLASRYRNPHAQWYVNHMTKPNTGSEAWYDILWYDPSVPETPPDALPLARHFQATGVAVVRTGWYAPDAAVVSFKCGDFYGGHAHLDQNSFTIYRKGHLALDSGGYDSWASKHWRNYYTRTVAHNSITVFDPDEKVPNLRKKDASPANDGGQVSLYPDSNKILRQALTDTGDLVTHPKLDTGDIVVFEQAPSYARVLGDATRAYSSRKLKQFTRELVVLYPKIKTNPPAVVVFDRVQATRPEYAKKWLLHTAQQPAQAGPGTWRATEGAGTLYVSMLEPRGAKVTLVGGPGREFEVNGVNYPLPEKDASNRPPNVPGNWRIEVEPPAPAERDLFLNVLIPVDKGESSVPAVSRMETRNMLGGFVKGERGEPDTIVWFARDKDVLDNTESLSYRLSGNGPVRHLIADLPANVEYEVRLDGKLLQTQRTPDTRTDTAVRKHLAPSSSLSFATPAGAGGTIAIGPVRL